MGTKLIRTFHPVGQGAFYSERHNFHGNVFTIIYDCGSTTIKGNKLEKKIKSSFTKNQTIDILFISHFHADHINGIEYLKNHCKINKVIIPFIDDETKILIKVSNLLDNNYTNTNLIDNPKEYFGNETQVIQINPTEIDSNREGIGLDESIDISTISTENSYNSGTLFSPYKGIEWLFIPFNYKHNERKKQFEKELNKCGLSLKEIDSLDKIKNKIEVIKKAYKSVEGDLNCNSLILYSGKKSNEYINCMNHFNYYNFHPFFRKVIESGCLYMGDIDLNEPNIVDDIFSKLKKVFSYIGTIQIPHHGSIHNFNYNILKKDIFCAIFSFGTNNTFGHPSDKVISEVISNHCQPFFVTENQNSLLVQFN